MAEHEDSEGSGSGLTRTFEIEYHRDRKIIHFGSPPTDKYWREEKPKPTKKKKKRKKGKKK